MLVKRFLFLDGTELSFFPPIDFSSDVDDDAIISAIGYDFCNSIFELIEVDSGV